MTNSVKLPRIEVVDALRGFAILSIMLLHNLEHFDFYFLPEQLPVWMKSVDGKIWDSLFFLFSGKSYAIFALLFGFTFFIQLNNRQKDGYDFRTRFLWRLTLLLLFGIINSVFYQGDILALYAVMGVALVPVRRWSNKAVLATAIILMLQPFEWGRYIYMLAHPDYSPIQLSNQYFEQTNSYLSGSSFWELAKGNLFNGRTAVVLWFWENGRIFQTPSLFMLGMLLGRAGLFVNSQKGTKFWINVLWIAIASFVLLFTLKMYLPAMIDRKVLANQLVLIIGSWSNFAFMSVLVSLFVVLYQKQLATKLLSKLIPFGKMSLTNYVMQSMLGSIIYYGYGLGMYKYTGATYSLLIGIGLFVFQLLFCRWWLKRHKQGPLEYLWHKATWIKSNK